jgi:branched-subunit amino acid transport protein
MALVTYLTRAPLLLALARRPLPPGLRLWLRFVPLAVLPALALPLIVVDQGRLVAPRRTRRCGAPSSCSCWPDCA